MLRTFTTGLFLWASVIAHGEVSVGLATSGEPFVIQRGERVLEGAAVSPFLVNEGDVIRPGSGSLRVDTVSGESILVGGDSTFEVTRPLHYKLQDGRAAISLAGESSDSRVVVSDLEFRRIGPHDSSEATPVHQIALGTNPDGSEVAIISNGGMVAVTSILSGEQIAIVGFDEMMGFIKDHLGNWTTVMPTAQETQRELEGVGESAGEEGVFGVIPAFFGAGSAGAAGAAAVVAGGAVGATVGVQQLAGATESRSTTTSSQEPATGIVPPPPGQEPGDDRDPNTLIPIPELD
ncbi:MAG: hypothetical protein JJU11_12195 [Candidatus Sumerlaeia bacterium]|nr:hypothetical protein [Candidatus Sumerlaeia bacterium]